MINLSDTIRYTVKAVAEFPDKYDDPLVQGELAGLDGDHNGWIDENDAAFSSLKIWQKPRTTLTKSARSVNKTSAPFIAAVPKPNSILPRAAVAARPWPHGSRNRACGLMKAAAQESCRKSIWLCD
jgi:hypothetical protein